MNSQITEIVIFASSAFILAGLGACLTAFGFAISFKRYCSKGKKEHTHTRRADEMSLVKNSDKVGSAISLIRKILFAAEFLAIYMCATGVLELFGANPDEILEIAILAASLFITLFIQHTFFDIPAANMGTQKADEIIKLFSKLFAPFYLLARPADLISHKIARKIFKKTMSGKLATLNYMDVELKLRAENADTESLSPYAEEIVRNALDMSELDVSDAMIPRSRVVYLDLNDTFEENVEKVKTCKFARYPICRESLDECLGLVRLKDFFENPPKSNDDFFNMRRDALRVKENDPLESALAKMIKYDIHMALVEDMFGGVIGALMLGVVVNELFGKTGNNYGKDTEIRTLGKNRYKISGLASLRKVEDFLGIDFNNDEVSTFGGLITYSLGRFPEKGEKIFFKEQKMRVLVEESYQKKVGECYVQTEEDASSKK